MAEQPSKSPVHTFGTHQAWIEDDVAIWVVWNGDVVGSDIDEIGRILRTLPDGVDEPALVQDVSKVMTFTPEARKKIIEQKSSQKLQLVVLVGASFHLRLIQRMIASAMRILHRAEAELKFADNFEEGRAIVKDFHRRRRQRSQKSSQTH